MFTLSPDMPIRRAPTVAGSQTSWVRQLRPLVIVATTALLVACADDIATANITGQLGHAPANAAGLEVKTSPLLAMETHALTDSPETSLTGLTIEVVRVKPDGTTDGVKGTATPDANGRFKVGALPVIDVLPPNNGAYQVKIVQPANAKVKYGASGSLRWLNEGEDLALSLPLVTQLQLPLWAAPSTIPPEEHDALRVQLAVDDVGQQLIYVTPSHGIGLYNTRNATVDLLRASEALTMFADDTHHGVMPRVAEKSGVIIVMMVRGWQRKGRVVLLDLAAFKDPETSETFDLATPADVVALGSAVTVLNLPIVTPTPLPPERVYEHPGFPVRSFETKDGSRFFVGERLSTYGIDLTQRKMLGVWHDGGYLGGYNAEAGLLFIDMPNGVVRIRSAQTGAIIADRQLPARYLLGVAELPGGKTLVSYQAKASMTHRMAVFDAKGAIERDEAATDFLGYAERYHNPAYEWGTCGPAFVKGTACPVCDPPPSDYFEPWRKELHRLAMVFDAERQQLLLGGTAYALEGGLFHPLPAPMCGRFQITDDCTGHPFHDLKNRVEIVRSLFDPTVVCTQTSNDSDLVVAVKLDGEHSGSSDPVVMSSAGIGFVATPAGLTAIHYRNPKAATQPAVRDLRVP